jgi:hypothetical protein
MASHRVSVDQLRTMLQEQNATGKSDDAAARQIGALQLTERLTQPVLDELMVQFKPGPKAGLALTILADLSAFLNPPASESPSLGPPDSAAQQAMVSAAFSYVANTLQHLPNILATRATRSFDDNPLVMIETGMPPQRTDLHLAGTFTQEITYRDGHEALSNPTAAPGVKPSALVPPGLTSWGEFGPVLAIIITDAGKGGLVWSRWERTGVGSAAIFEYKVPREASHYAVKYCCVRSSDGPNLDHPGLEKGGVANSYNGTPGYHGTLSLDPGTGAILRITIQSELKSTDPINRNDIEVRYGPVEIGGRSYICPVRSVAISSALLGSETSFTEWTVLRVNDVTFTNYHRFGSSVRVLPGAN